MTDQRQLLLQAILDNPADDMARLVYADWLEENGEEARAEFIRVQCRKESMKAIYDPISPLPDGHPAHVEWLELTHREMQLLGEPRALRSTEKPPKWRIDLFHAYSHWAWRRGFIAEITLSSADWFTHHAEILAEHPVEVVRLTDLDMVRTFGYYKGQGRGEEYRKYRIETMKDVENYFASEWPRITFYLPKYGESGLKAAYKVWKNITSNLPSAKGQIG